MHPLPPYFVSAHSKGVVRSTPQLSRGRFGEGAEPANSNPQPLPGRHKGRTRRVTMMANELGTQKELQAGNGVIAPR
jgi:hypothetical protein